MTRLLILLSVVLSAPGCLNEPGTRCGVGVCAAGKACDVVHGGCVEPEQLSSCQGLANESSCSAPGIADGACFEGVCFPRGCGNGQIEADEVCDDGNNLFGDDCAADCLSDETCGNGVVDSARGEACDDGNNVDGDGCQAECVLPTCGDGVIDQFENCDDGAANSNEPDALCRTNCQPQGCGDGIADLGSNEVCDDGNSFAGDGCTPDCLSAEVCGNGIVDFLAGELCDDANLLNQDGCSVSCGLEAGTWSEVLGGSPPSISNYSLAYDAARGNVVLFGGNNGVQPNSETWVWDGTVWTEVNTTGLRPPSIGSMVYDAARAEVVMYASGETWTWNGAAWSKEAPAGETPGDRTDFAMAYDSVRRRVVLFGGLTGVETSDAIDDTWIWNGDSWTELAPTDSPPARRQHSMAFDVVRNQLVLFGGKDANDLFLDDTWLFDGANWSQAAPAQSPTETRHAMAYDAERGVVVLLGLNDTMLWDGENWSSTGVSSLPVTGIQLAYDSHRQRTVVFGGDVIFGGQTNIVSEWDGTAWLNETPAEVTPPGRFGGRTAYDSRRGEMIVLGGFSFGEPARDDMWIWNGRFWTERVVALPPNDGGSMVYDPLLDKSVLFSGTETWEWDGQAWVLRTPAQSPPARTGHAMAFDGVGVLIYGGREANSNDLGDTWRWDGSTWLEINAGFAGRQVAMAFDSRRQRAVVFGGEFGETFELVNERWTRVTPVNSASPPERFAHAMVYDERKGRVVLFGGRDRFDFNNTFADTWEWDGTDWAETTPAANPPARHNAMMVYESARGVVVLFGGGQGGNVVGQEDTWLYRTRDRQQPDESCSFGFDGDGDGAIGCDDPDCAGVCTPLCLPEAPTCDPATPQCGDAVCDATFENCRLCADDCGPCTEICGDFICEGAEDNATCPADCSP